MPNRRGQIIFEWEHQWYSVSNRFQRQWLSHIVLPSGIVLKHNGHYDGVLVFDSDPAAHIEGFTEIPHSIKKEDLHMIAKRYKAEVASQIEEHVPIFDEE